MLVFALPRKRQSQQSKKVDFWRVPGQKSNREEPIILPVCIWSVWTENLHITGCTYKTRNTIKKTCKNQLQITKRKSAKTQRECVSLRGNWRTCVSQNSFCSARLPCCSTGRTGKSLSPLHFLDCHRLRKGDLARAASSVLSFLLIFWDPPRAALLGEMSITMTVSEASQADVLCYLQRPRHVCPTYVPLLTRWTFTPLSLIAYFQKQLISLSRKLS